MSTDASFTPPKKKHNVLWWVAGGFALLIFVFFLQLFGPNPPIVVSPQTTYITSPLGPDGLPDYEQYVLEQSRAGVTPENNAAALLYQALWPGELEPKDYAAVAKELGLEEIPSQDDALRRLYDSENRQRVAGWLLEQGKLKLLDQNDEELSDEQVMELAGGRMMDEAASALFDTVERVIGDAASRPWTSQQIPPLAKWVAENQGPLDLIVAASRRPRFYSPSPTLLNKDRDMLIAMLFAGTQSVREAGRSLQPRAMWHLGEGRPMEAWEDVLAVHRLSRLLTQGRTMVEQLVAIAMSGIACDSTASLLHHGDLTVDQARRIQRDLAAIPPFNGMAPSIDEGERLWAVDGITQLATSNSSETFKALDISNDDFGNGALNAVSLDWNLVLREMNQWYDRLAAAARLPDRSARRAAVSQVEADIRELEMTVNSPSQWLSGVVSRQHRSRLVTSIMVALFLPALNAAMAAEDRANCVLDLTRVAAALAVYRAEHGAYPEKLDDLVPGVLDKLPVDLYSGKPLYYKRIDDGYLLYSAGENGIDDGGSHSEWNIFEGLHLDDFDVDSVERDRLQEKMPAVADDVSIRVPKPKRELPKVPATAEQP